MKLQCIYPSLDQPQRRRRRKRKNMDSDPEKVKRNKLDKLEEEEMKSEEKRGITDPLPEILDNPETEMDSSGSNLDHLSSPDSLEILNDDLTTAIDNILMEENSSIQENNIHLNNFESNSYVHIDNDYYSINQSQSSQPSQPFQSHSSLGYEFEQRHLYSMSYFQAHKLIEAYECEVNCMYPMFPMGTLKSKFNYIYDQYCINGSLTATEEDDFADIKIIIAIGSSISDTKVACGKRLYEDFMSRVERRLLSRSSDIKTVVSLLLVHSYQFLSDLGMLAYRSLEFASIMALELGIHKSKQLEKLFPNFEEREHGKVVFWCLYIMDRLQSIYTKRPYILHDADIDQDLPQCFDIENVMNNNLSDISKVPTSSFVEDDLFRSMHLNYMIRYSKLSGQLMNALGNEQQTGYMENMQHLIFLMERWRTSLPPELNINTEDTADITASLNPNQYPGRHSLPIGSRKLKYIADLRPSLILLHVYQSCNVEAYLHPAINTSCDCIRELGRLYFNTGFYSSCETQYNHVLVAALEVLYACLRWAPQYAKSCMPEIKLALKIISLIMKSSNSDRRQGNIWQLLMSFSFKFGLYSPFGAAKICDSSPSFQEEDDTNATREVLITSLISELGGNMTSSLTDEIESTTTSSIIEEVINDDMF